MRRRDHRARAVALALLVALGPAACGPAYGPEPRTLRPAAADSPALSEMRRLLAAGLGRLETERLRRLGGLAPGDPAPPPAWLADALARTEADAAPLDGGRLSPLPPGSGRGGPAFYADRWRTAWSTLHLDADGPLDPSRPLRFSGLQATESVVVFRSLADAPLEVAAACDGPVRLLQPGQAEVWRDGADLRFALRPRERDRTGLALSPATDACALRVTAPRAPPFALRLEREEAADPALAALDSRFDLCRAPPADPADPLAAAFHAPRWLSQTCAVPVEQAILLPDPRDGFNAKVEALLGRPLPDAAFDAGDPTIPLDFSRAPRLDLIYLSYLDLKADFSGAIIERLLRHHAERGTLVRILVSGVLENPLDRALFDRLAADHPNVQIQLYTWEPGPFPTPDQMFDALHRTHHVKLFLTLSPEPGRSRAILGGRNIHDGFLFDRALDLSAFPGLQTYGEPGEFDLNYFSTYSDFEAEYRGEDWVRTLAAHLATVWHRDAATNLARPFSVSMTGPAPVEGRMRHFVSIPYRDGRALEALYVDLIDSAARSVEIVSPYLNPTPAIEAALIRASARGVAVRFVARVRLYGDLGGRLMTELNMLFVERHAGRFEIVEHIPESVVLHTKLLVVDERLAVVTSANLNRRSFLHDTENGVLVLDREFAHSIRGQLDAYRERAVPATPDSYPVRPLSRQLFLRPEIRDLF
jgi:cardiolipin synthase